MKRNITIIGGGNGSAKILRGLKTYSDEMSLSAVIAMSDSGSSNGELRKKWKVMPPADILRATLALSPYDYDLLHQIFRGNRFDYGMDHQHYLGNLFLALSQKDSGDFIKGLDALHVAIEAVGRAYPVSLDQIDLGVELSNGEKVIGEDLIDRPTYDRALKIKKAWLLPAGEIYDGAKKAIADAEVIILSLGSLYTSVIATILVRGVKEAIEKNKNAKLIYIAGGALEALGETGPESLSQSLEQLEYYLPRKVDTVIFNNSVLSDKQKDRHQEKQWQKVALDIDNLADRNLIGVDMEKNEGGISPEKLGDAIYRFIFSN